MSLTSPSKFFDACRAGVMGPTLDDNEVSGANTILEACAGLPISWTAYALATAWHETAHTMQPVRENGGPRYFTKMYDIAGSRPTLARKMGNTSPGDGAKFYGRGYPQVTWKVNYIKADAKLAAAGLIKPGELLADPDLALRPDLAAFIMRHGMKEGWFTGKSFASYLPAGPATRKQFILSRYIINGVDKAALIAGYAMEFQAALQAGGWS